MPGSIAEAIINLKVQVVQLIAFLWGSKEDLDTKATRQRYKAQRAAKESMNKKLVELSIEKGLQLPQPSGRPASLTTEQLLAESRRWRMRKTKLNSILAASTPELEDPGAAFDQPSDKL